MKKRGRILLFLIGAAWIFVVVQSIAGALFDKNSSIVAAFSSVDAGEQEGILEIAAKYKGDYLDAYDKRQMIYYLAGVIGLEINGEMETVSMENRSEVFYQKTADAAETCLRVVSMTKSAPEHYVYAKISLKSSIASVNAYKKLLEEAMQEINCTDISTTLQLIGSYEGYLTVERRNKITDEILDAMGGKIAYEHREDDLYTVYAYTGLIDDYITVEGKKINLHIAMSKDEANYRTRVYLASPILPDTW